ncbi:MAG TPA: beta-methylgalactoside transporter [Candidatus Gemmiger faecigallinarum]|nr:beta-methylgalactoside transporter [Candidatus Gemmiger faecigallinarum]
MKAIANLKQGMAEFKAMDARDKRSKVVDTLLNNAIYILLIIFVVFTAVQNPNFLLPSSLVNIVSLAASSLPTALGIAGCIVLTGTDLSAGRVVGLTAAISAALLQASDWANKMFDTLPEIPIPVVLLAVILVGGIIGLVNGFFVAKFSLHPFIVTLATQLIVYGLLLEFYMLNGNNGQPLSGLSDTYRNFITGTMFRIPTGNGQSVAVPWYVLYAVILVAIMWFVWNKTTFGKNMFAVGSNPEAANVSGVNVFMTTMLVHTLAGCMYGIEGFIESARIASNTANTGLNYESDAIAACVIGGVSFVGGTGKISGIVLGVFILRIIFAALTMLSISGNTQYIIKGLIILIACSIDMRKYLVKK